MGEILIRLLRLANSSPPVARREEFYALKDRLLRRYATRDGYHVQEIRKECWGCEGSGSYGDRACSKCDGTGVFDHFFVRLEVYRWRGYTFHRPVERRCRPTAAPDIRGYVQHAQRGPWAAEATLWLCLLAGEWGLLSRLLVGSCRPCAPRRAIGLQLQRLCFWLHLRRIRRCAECERWSWGSRGCPRRCASCQRKLFCPATRPSEEVLF